MGPERSSSPRHRRDRARPRERAAARARWLVLIALASLAACDSVVDLDRHSLFHPERARANEDLAGRVDGLERWWIDGEGAGVEAWYLPPLEHASTPAPAVIIAHGNAELIDDWATRVEPYRRMGVAVLLPEYRGYGRSRGTPTEAGILEDFERFYDRLVERPDIDGSRVVMHGRSLGGGVVGVLSSRRPAAALVLESTFTNVPDIASQWLVPSGFIRDRFDTREVLLRSSTPVLIVHGVDDEVVPFKHARELYRVAWDGRLVPVPHAGHDVPHDGAYWSRVRAFLEETGVLPNDN